MKIRNSRHYFICILAAAIALGPFFTVLSNEAADNKEITFKPEMESKFSRQDPVFDTRVSLDLRDMDIVEALKFLASKANLNIISRKSVTGRISLTVQNCTIRDIFDIMLRANSLAYVKQGDIYDVMTEAEYKASFGRNFSDTRKVKMVRLKYAAPEQAFSLLDALKSEIGRVLVDTESGNVLIMDESVNIERMEKALADFEKENVVRVFTLQYAKASEVEEILKSQLDAKKAGSIKADERNNQVVVQTFPQRMLEIERLIKNLDKQTKEVLIDAKIIKVSLSDKIDDGIEWEGLFRLFAETGITYLGSYPFSAVQPSTDDWRSRNAVRKALGDDVGSYPFSGTSSNFSASTKMAPGQSVHVGTVNNAQDFDLVINYLKTLGQTRILSNPKIVAVNNQEAKIHVGERQAYVTTTTTTGQATSTIAEEVNFVDIGVQLSVTPTINDDGYITLKIKPEISSVTSTLITPTNNKIPIIDTSLAETTVMVKDGVSVIISGLRKDEVTNSYEQVPILGSIPLINRAFRTGYHSVVRTELLILLTPHIISGVQLTSGNESDFTHESGVGYQDYSPLAADKKLISKAAPSDKTELKPYRELKEEAAVLDKGAGYEP